MPPRTLLITPYFDAALPSGGVLFSVDVVREWLARGRAVAVLCARRERSLGDLELFARSGLLRLHEIATPEQVRFTHHFHPPVYERARAAIDDFLPQVVHAHNTQGLLAALRAALDWRDGLAGPPNLCRVLLTALDFGLLCFNHYLYDRSPRPCPGPESPRHCARCVRRTIHGPLRWASGILPQPLTRRFWPDFVRLDQAQSAPALHEMMRRILRRLDVIVAPSPIMAETLAAAAGPQTCVHRTIYGVNPAKIRRPTKTASPIVRLAYFGSDEPVKGLHILIAASERLPDGLPLQIRAVGNEGVGRKLAAASPLARRYLSHSAPVFGRRLAEAHADIDAVLVPSLWHENSPFVVLESLANGTAVLASDTAGIRHLIEPEHTGRLIPPGDVTAWAAAIDQCVREPAALSRMGAAACFNRTTADFVNEIEGLEEAGSPANDRRAAAPPRTHCMATAADD